MRGYGEDGQRLFPVPARTNPEEASGRAGRWHKALRLISWGGGFPHPEPAELELPSPAPPALFLRQGNRSGQGNSLFGVSAPTRHPPPPTFGNADQTQTQTQTTNGLLILQALPGSLQSPKHRPPQGDAVLSAFYKRGKLRPRYSCERRRARASSA